MFLPIDYNESKHENWLLHSICPRYLCLHDSITTWSLIGSHQCRLVSLQLLMQFINIIEQVRINNLLQTRLFIDELITV